MFWFIGANTPIMNNAIKFLLKCQKIILGIYLDMLCLLTKFCEKRTIFMGSAKKTKQHLVKVYFAGPEIVFFT
jgi:hypothetical protein